MGIQISVKIEKLYLSKRQSSFISYCFMQKKYMIIKPY